jgi:hypothetical protein
MQYRGKLEFAEERKIRERNTGIYRLCHWPIWIWVFFLTPGPLTFSLFAHGFHGGNWIWLSAVLLGTGVAGLNGQLPGTEGRPYILRFDEDKPNPLYRRVCYTFAWNAAINFALLNLVGIIINAFTGVWYMQQIYNYAYFPVCAVTSTAPSGRSPPARPSCLSCGRPCLTTMFATSLSSSSMSPHCCSWVCWVQMANSIAHVPSSPAS